MDFAPIALNEFLGREAALARIRRYIHFITPVMFYRTNDLTHSRRVLWHLEEALPEILSVHPNFRIDFSRTLALVHDDVEILTGDVQLYDKERMQDSEKYRLLQKEKESIPQIVDIYGKTANGFDYQELLTAAKEKNCLEARFVSFFDKFDGAGEAWHEIWAGNYMFARPAGVGEDGGYIRRLNAFPHKYPDMQRFFEEFSTYLPLPYDFLSAAERKRPHTAQSLLEDSGYPPYEKWKRTIIAREGVDLLIMQTEFLPQ